jgi:hypothetical protein
LLEEQPELADQAVVEDHLLKRLVPLEKSKRRV